jgi:hypothetical protein
MSKLIPKRAGWIGVDLDGTLAEYHGWKGPEHIGPPVDRMVRRIKAWLDDGESVRIFTARAADSENLPFIKDWLKQTGLPGLEITDKKDFGCKEIWDDRAVRVQTNTGERIR